MGRYHHPLCFRRETAMRSALKGGRPLNNTIDTSNSYLKMDDSIPIVTIGFEPLKARFFSQIYERANTSSINDATHLETSDLSLNFYSTTTALLFTHYCFTAEIKCPPGQISPT